jgi:hypothetical protein
MFLAATKAITCCITCCIARLSRACAARFYEKAKSRRRSVKRKLMQLTQVPPPPRRTPVGGSNTRPLHKCSSISVQIKFETGPSLANTLMNPLKFKPRSVRARVAALFIPL